LSTQPEGRGEKRRNKTRILKIIGEESGEREGRGRSK
jgi:hypothetical protein